MAEKDRIKTAELIFLIILTAFIILFRAQAAHMPLDVNEGSHAYAAARVSQGVVPYKQVFEHAPPVMIYVYKAAFMFFGQSVEAVRNFTTMYVIAVMLSLFMLARVLWRSAFVSMLAVFFYVLYQHSLIFQGMSANAAIFAQLPVILSILFAIDREKKYEAVSFCASGFFAATALLTDIMTVFFALVPIIYALFYSGKKPLNSIAWFIAGYIALLASAAGWAFYNHAVYDIYTSVISFNIAALKTAVKGMTLGDFIAANIVPFIAFLYAVWKAIRNNKDGNNFILVFTAAALYAAVFMAKGAQPHYYMALIPAAAILCASMVFDMYALLNSEKEARPYAWIILAMFLVLNTAVVSGANRLGLFMKSGMYTDSRYYEQRAMAHTIIMSSENKEIKENFIFAWPDMPAVYFTAGVKAATRYAYAYPLDVFTQDKQTVLDTLFQGRPSWVVMQRGTYSSYQAFLDNYYAKAAETKNLVLYRNILF